MARTNHEFMNAPHTYLTSRPSLLSSCSFLHHSHFSGYLNIPGSTGHKHVHYWMVEASDVDPATAPTIFWTNGGPGCSGLLGMLTEQGPFRPLNDGSVVINDYAWNKYANVIFYEQVSENQNLLARFTFLHQTALLMVSMPVTYLKFIALT